MKTRSYCWCGCGNPVPDDAYFRPGHDVRAILWLVRAEYGTIQNAIAAHGYGPGRRDWSLFSTISDMALNGARATSKRSGRD